MRYLMAAHTDVGIKKKDKSGFLHDKRSTDKTRKSIFLCFM